MSQSRPRLRVVSGNAARSAAKCAKIQTTLPAVFAGRGKNRRASTTNPANTNPGNAHFQGKEIGGGVVASRWTASITASAKPLEGTISCSADSARSSSSHLMLPPNSACQNVVQIARARSLVTEKVWPSRCPVASRGCGLRPQYPFRGNKTGLSDLDIWRGGQELRCAALGTDFLRPSRHR
jgi:hypothetical protein